MHKKISLPPDLSTDIHLWTLRASAYTPDLPGMQGRYDPNGRRFEGALRRADISSHQLLHFWP